jgi:hypothetical protein
LLSILLLLAVLLADHAGMVAEAVLGVYLQAMRVLLLVLRIL